MERYWVACGVELPPVLATGADEVSLAHDLGGSMATLSGHLEFDDPLTLPEGARLPWESEPPLTRVCDVRIGGAAWETLSSIAIGRLIEA